jgi:transcriptional regulator with XRE-family HTH domain
LSDCNPIQRAVLLQVRACRRIVLDRMRDAFANALKELQGGAGLSNRALAKRIDVDAAQVGRWRRATGLPRPDNIVRIAAVFGIDYQWLMNLAYPDDRRSSTAAPENPRLLAFLAEIGTGWRDLPEHERPVAERGARALFRVGPARAGARRRSNGPLADIYPPPSAAFNDEPAAAAA